MRDKSVDELEGISMQPPYVTGMIERIAKARTKPIGALTPEDLRLLVSQGVALAYTAPLALEQLDRRPLAQGALYVGDLLCAALHAEEKYALNPELRARLREITARALDELSKVQPTDWTSEAPFDPEAPDEIDRQSLEPKLREALTRLESAGPAV